MAMVLQTNRVPSSNSSTVTMDSPQQSADQEDTFHQFIFDKIDQVKQDRDPEKCQELLNNLKTMLKHLTADVNNYNLTFRETRPSFYMQQFQRLTDQIETLTKAQNILTEYLRELEDSNPIRTTFPYSSSFNDISSMNNQFTQQLEYSPTISRSARSCSSEKIPYEHTSSICSIYSGTKDIFTSDNDYRTSHRSRSPTLTTNNFIRIHFPNKHTTALTSRSDETLLVALQSRASRHSVTDLQAYTPVYMISRQPCSWHTTLNRLRETEVELVENPKLDHSFIRRRFFSLTYCDICHKILLQGLRCLVCGSRIHTRCIQKAHICPENIPKPRFPVFTGVHCIVCKHRIREAHKHCTSCGNYYHNQCRTKAPVCSHFLVDYMRKIPPDRFDNDRTNAQARTKEQSRSLPRIPIRHGVGPQKDTSQDAHGNPLAIPANVDHFSNAIQSTINISSNSLFQPSATILSSSLPSTAAAAEAASPIYHIPQLLLTENGVTLTSPKSVRPSITKPNSIGVIDAPKPYVSEWQIRSDDLISHGRMVGRGTYGTVYKAEVRLHGNVALKELNFLSPTPAQFQAFRNEVIALKKITHQNTLNFYGYILSPRFAIVTQWCEGSTLYKHIHILDRRWKINQLIDIARQICQGMSYLHDRGIIHRDMKSSNVFLDMCAEPDDAGICWRVKIGDFGLAAVKTVVAEGVNQQFQPTGSVLWMAPEVIQQKDPNCYSTSADVYAYGCVLFEMFSGKLPHAPINNKEQIMWLVGKGRLKIKVEQCRDDIPEPITELIRQCTEFDRDLRPNFAPEIDDILSKFEFISPRLQRSQSEPCLIRNPQDDLLGLSINFGVPKTPVSIHRRLNAEVS